MKKLVLQEHPEVRIVGGGVLIRSLIVMPILAAAKFRTARELSSDAPRSDATETLVCSLLSVTTLAGPALNATFGWWWADPVADPTVVPYVAWEGVEALRVE